MRSGQCDVHCPVCGRLVDRLANEHATQFAEVKHALFDDRFRRAEPVVTRAIERGELPADTDPAELLGTGV
ncbi:TetR/AcrR family transcriptional regulator C-terminal ligand-binding domain-containing protein [Streptomyces sp. NPDC048751]|uniref:TetR/AcrR family transcriptional regulator C-terminal ligand-binding domain-containing protein n=1 Tax=Streptomyces sp. NPDC048751 TaxID=3365591 RepID=UPI003710BD51